MPMPINIQIHKCTQRVQHITGSFTESEQNIICDTCLLYICLRVITFLFFENHTLTHVFGLFNLNSSQSKNHYKVHLINKEPNTWRVNLSNVSQDTEKRIMSDSKAHFQQLVNANNGQIFSEATLKFIAHTTLSSCQNDNLRL